MHGRRGVAAGLTVTVLLAACQGPGQATEPAEDEAGQVAEDEAGQVAELEAEVAGLRQQVLVLEARAERLADELAEAQEREPGDDPAPTEGLRGPPAPPHTAAGLEDALRAYLPDGHGEWLPGVTRWRDSGLELPGALTDPAGAAAGPGELTVQLLEAVVDTDAFGGTTQPESAFPWEVTARVLRTADDEAFALVQQWGTGDDSVSGIDYRFTLRQGSDGWYVTELAERYQCTRNDRLPGEADLPDLCV